MSDLFDALRPGSRVVVRYRLEPPESGLSDALGELLWVRGEGAERRIGVLTKRGEVAIATSSITHAKPVPPPPARRASH